ncbi:MAG: HupE/UreJ family protein [Myxococcales bacterium]|nr:HupE/UreJ family protein [Myxococcales bacterium]MCB9644319.1 HupE/UreJ family protein [Myxococcales bacterium]
MRVKIDTKTGDLRVAISVSSRDLGNYLKLGGNENKKIPFPVLDAGRKSIEDYMASRLLISNNGKLCHAFEQKMRWGQGGRRALLFQKRRCGKPIGELVIENKILLEDEGSHRHHVRIEVDGKPSRRTIISQFFPSYTLTFKSPTTRATKSTSQPVSRPILPQGRALIVAFLWEGIWHIWTGFDHVLFLVVLLFTIVSLRQLLWIVTAFTLGHTVTLMLSVLDIVTLPPRPVEVAIALSIAIVASENIWKEKPLMGYRAGLAGFFGLVHGFGFSYLLRDKVTPQTSGLLPALFSFNVGVELGQLAIVLVAYPLLQILLQSQDGKRWQRFLNAVVLALALYWAVVRTLGIDT